MHKQITLFLLILILNHNCIADVTIIHNIKGNTINQHKHVKFNAIAFEDGKIISIKNYDSLMQKYPNATIIDGKGKAMLPGLHDAHGHVLSLAKLKNEVDLMGCQHKVKMSAFVLS